MSAEGVLIDSDLATYAQSMAGVAHPELFQEDPVLHSQNAASYIWNLQSSLAWHLMPDENYAVGLLRAGGCVIFLFFVSWYCLGRWLFKNRLHAVLLSLLAGITVWVGCGTFWGVTHSDPVPRVMHSALWPWMLMLAIAAYDRASLRPIAMFVAGLGMWLHGVSALNTGAMFFTAFFFHRPKNLYLREHFGLLFLSCLAFLIPVLFFLWPSLGQGRAFTQEELATFQELFLLRWHEDYGDIWETLSDLFSIYHHESYLLYAGIVTTIYCMSLENKKIRTLSRMIPSFVIGIACVFIFSVLETKYAGSFGRLPMGHELVRGIKFLIPLSWLMICAVFCIWLSRLPGVVSFIFVLVVLIAILSISQDKQYIAAQYALSEITGINLPLTKDARLLKKEAAITREAVEKVHKIVPRGELVSAHEDCMMAIRYIALRPLQFLFKDAYVYYYSKNLFESKKWLHFYYAQMKNIDESSVKYTVIDKENSQTSYKQKQILWENTRWVIVSP